MQNIFKISFNEILPTIPQSQVILALNQIGTIDEYVFSYDLPTSKSTLHACFTDFEIYSKFISLDQVCIAGTLINIIPVIDQDTQPIYDLKNANNEDNCTKLGFLQENYKENQNKKDIYSDEILKSALNHQNEACSFDYQVESPNNSSEADFYQGLFFPEEYGVFDEDDDSDMSDEGLFNMMLMQQDYEIINTVSTRSIDSEELFNQEQEQPVLDNDEQFDSQFSWLYQDPNSNLIIKNENKFPSCQNSLKSIRKNMKNQLERIYEEKELKFNLMTGMRKQNLDCAINRKLYSNIRINPPQSKHSQVLRFH